MKRQNVPMKKIIKQKIPDAILFYFIVSLIEIWIWNICQILEYLTNLPQNQQNLTSNILIILIIIKLIFYYY